MKYEEFLSWLKDECSMSERSARDVISRCRRVLVLTGQKNVDSKTMDLLINTSDFIECSTSIRSQLKRSITLYAEFLMR